MLWSQLSIKIFGVDFVNSVLETTKSFHQNDGTQVKYTLFQNISKKKLKEKNVQFPLERQKKTGPLKHLTRLSIEVG